MIIEFAIFAGKYAIIISVMIPLVFIAFGDYINSHHFTVAIVFATSWGVTNIIYKLLPKAARYIVG